MQVLLKNKLQKSKSYYGKEKAQETEKDFNQDVNCESEVKYQCEHCEYKSKYSFAINRHRRSMHEGIKYECSLCDHKATTQSNLKRHQKNKHR